MYGAGLGIFVITKMITALKLKKTLLIYPLLHCEIN